MTKTSARIRRSNDIFTLEFYMADPHRRIKHLPYKVSNISRYLVGLVASLMFLPFWYNNSAW